MNRIRRCNNNFQVLCVPHQKFNVGFEFILGTWNTSSSENIFLKTFDNYSDAEFEAEKDPDINWTQLVDFHKDSFYDIKQKLSSALKHFEMTVNLKATLLSPEKLKNAIFERTSNKSFGKILGSICETNCVFFFRITNPWYENIVATAKYLINIPELRIFQHKTENKIISLIGRTDIGTIYEILIMPDLLSHLMDWLLLHEIKDFSTIEKYIKKILQIQNNVDNSFVLK